MRIVAPNYSVAAFCFAMIGCLAAQAHSQVSGAPASLDLRKVLTGHRSCMIGNDSVQFVNENELVLLSGPGADCYRAVPSLELVIVAMNGQILARKPLPSTFPFVVLSGGRIAVGGVGEFTVLNDALQVLQTVPLPGGERSSVLLQKEGADILLARLPRGQNFAYSGTPLAQTERHEAKQDDRLVYQREIDETVVMRKGELFVVQRGGPSRRLADLTWLHDCNKLCQAWSGGTNWTVSENGKRAVFMSSGTRFPVTDASGLLPFWRLLVIDLATGKEIYRKEFDTRTSRRSAQLSPKGDLLLLNDEDKLQFQPLN